VIPLARPVLGREEEAAVIEVLRSGHLSLGPRVGAFERDFAARFGDGVVASAVSSGTAGLHLALRVAGVGEGDEVITSPFSFIASANSILYERATPVFVDVDPDTLCIPAAAVAAAVTERTKAILPVHIFGWAADVPGMEPLGLPIVEDACESLGAVHEDGTLVGSRGHSAVFAFYANKQMTTGEGGMVVTRDRAAKDRIDSERNQGRAPDMDWLDHDRLGFNYRLSDIACAVGIEQLKRLDYLLEARRHVAELYEMALGDLPVELPLPRESWFVYVVRLPRGVDRDAAIEALRERGVASKPYLPAIHLFSFYRERFGYREGQFPVAEDAAARSLALPFFPGLTEGEIEHVARSLAGVLGLT
jgi:perosamine synthetase